MRKNKTPWRILDSDIGEKWQSSSAGQRQSGQLSRQPASMDRRSARLFLVHIPTNVDVSGEIPEGHYSNSDLQKKKKELRESLIGPLEEKVAKILRIPGFEKR